MKRKRGTFFYVLLVLAVVALGGLLYLLNPSATPETAPVHLAPLPSAEPTPARSGGASADRRLIAVDADTVRSVLGSLSRAESYSRTLSVQRFWSSGSVSTELSVWVRGDSIRIAGRDESGQEEKNVLLRGGEKWIWYTGQPGVWHGPAREGDGDAYQMLSPYEDILRLDRGAILDAGCETYEDELCIYVRSKSGSLGYETLSYISVDTGLPVRTEVYDGQTLIYAMYSSPALLTPPDSVVFAAPE
ncbi:MAG: hypothetical protein IJU29_08105 [Oscillospiraceae bacterium]|nr:hypothetical protein [Oscillospiraceae bacterium]